MIAFFAGDSSLYGAVAILLGAIPPAVTLLAVSRGGFSELAAPSGIPNMLVYLSTSVAVLVLVRPGSEVQYFAWGRTVPSDEVWLVLLLAASCFALGSLARFSPREVKSSKPFDPSFAATVSRVALLSVTAFNLYRASFTDPATRGQGQVDRGWLDSLVVGTTLVAIAATLILLAAASSQGSNRLLPRMIDYLLVLAPGLAEALLGSRGGLVVALFTLLLAAAFRGLLSARGLLGNAGLVLLVAAGVLAYRSNQDWQAFTSPSLVFEASLGSVAASFGLTYSLVPSVFPLEMGTTYFQAVLGLLPGPLAATLFGTPRTGALAFRDLIGFTNPDAGLGYSIPAEAVMNFGPIGAALVPFLLAVGMGLLYSYASLQRPSALSLSYFLAGGTFLAIWRSDALGLLKTVTYGVVIVGAILAFARWRAKASSPATPLRTGPIQRMTS